MHEYPDIARLKIELEGTAPRVWRRVHVSFFTKLGGLHRIIQAVMGWDDGHPHRFILSGDIYDRVAPGEALDAVLERNWRLDSSFYRDTSFVYAYGPNDRWLHRISLEEYLAGNPHWRYPRCVGGEGAWPPETGEPFDVGRVSRRLWRRYRYRPRFP